MESNKQGFFSRVFRPDAKAHEVRKASAFVLPPSRSTTSDVNVDSALGLATVYRSVNIISTGVSQLSLETYRGTDKIDSPLVVTQPDSNRSLSSFLKRTATGLATNGNAYWRLYRNAAGVVNNIEVLNPLEVIVNYSDTGVKSYGYGNKTFTDATVKHLRYMEVPGHIYGVGPIQAYTKGLAGSIALSEYSNNWLKKSGVPTGLLKTNGELDSEIAAATKEQWHRNLEDGGIAVLGNGLEFTPLLMTAADIQFIESSHLSDLQIARIFGVDPAFLALAVQGSSLTYANRTELDVQFIRWTLMAYLMEIEDAISSVLPRGQFVKFNVTDFLRAYESTPDTNSSKGESQTQHNK